MNPRSLTPSMSLLLAFDAAARNGSFTKASVELSLTQSAISRQVQALEDLLGVSLFVRSHRHIALTEVGTSYANDLAASLERIRNATSQAMAYRGGRGALRLAVLPTFGSKWLMPRMPDFYSGQPQAMVHIHSRAGELNFDNSMFDAAIGVGEGEWPNLVSHRLFEDEVIVIASCELMEQQPIRAPADVCAHRLLQMSIRPRAWHEWLAAHNVSDRRLRMGQEFELVTHMIQSVKAGMGLALVTKLFVEEEIVSGSIVAPFEAFVSPRRAYYFLYPPSKEAFEPLVAFREWLLNAASRGLG